MTILVINSDFQILPLVSQKIKNKWYTKLMTNSLLFGENHWEKMVNAWDLTKP